MWLCDDARSLYIGIDGYAVYYMYVCHDAIFFFGTCVHSEKRSLAGINHLKTLRPAPSVLGTTTLGTWFSSMFISGTVCFRALKLCEWMPRWVGRTFVACYATIPTSCCLPYVGGNGATFPKYPQEGTWQCMHTYGVFGKILPREEHPLRRVLRRWCPSFLCPVVCRIIERRVPAFWRDGNNIW